MSASVITFPRRAEAILRQKKAKEEQGFIEACERVLDEHPAMSLEELVRRATKQVEERAR